MSPGYNGIRSRIIFGYPGNVQNNNDATPGGRQTRMRAPASYGDQKLPSHMTMECHGELVEHETNVHATWPRTRVPPACSEKSGFHDAVTPSEEGL